MEDDYNIEASLSFSRYEGDITVTKVIDMGGSVEDMHHLLPKLLEFVQALGFTWAHGIAILNENGTVNYETFDTNYGDVTVNN